MRRTSADLSSRLILSGPDDRPTYEPCSQKDLSHKTERTDQDPLAHALPTSHVEDPDLALIVQLWDRLADECKQRVIEMIRASLPRQFKASRAGIVAMVKAAKGTLSRVGRQWANVLHLA